MGLALLPKRNPPPPSIRSSLPRLPGLEAVASVLDRLIATAQVGLAYGEPVTMGDRTIIPVGAVGYGFGFGFGGGEGRRLRGRRRRGGAGGGGGGGVNVQPIALIEITKKGVRVRPVLDWSRIIVAVLVLAVPFVLRRKGLRGWAKRIGTPNLT